jgi:hypothetical protein
MKIAPAQNEKELFPEGDHRLILFGFFHPGQLKSRDEWLPSDKFVFRFEAVDLEEKDFGSGPERQTISRTVYGRKYFEFLEELADRTITKKEREEGFDITELIGNGFLVQCLQVEKAEGKRYCNLRKIRSPLSDCGEPKSKALCFSMYHNPETGAPFATYHETLESKHFQRLADWQKEEIKKSETFRSFPDFKE